MSEDKGGEYTKRLSQELKNSLDQRGQEGGYDGLPVEEMQGMGINSHPGSTYGPIQDMDMGQQHFEDMPPAPPQDNNQVRDHISVRFAFLTF